MKRITLSLCAAGVGFLLAELVVRFALGFPTYGVEAKVEGIRNSDDGVQNLYQPHSRYWTVEGGNRVHARNNAGLPGIEVSTAPGSSYVLVCGSSYVEGLQVDPESLATSVLQRHLQHKDAGKQVLNLGHSGHDPFDSYFRAAYFARQYPPSRVILIIHDLDMSALWMNRHPHPLDFSIPRKFGTELPGLKQHLKIMARNTSTLANLLAEGWRYEGNGPAGGPPAPLIIPSAVHVPSATDAQRGRDVDSCLAAFARAYPDRFMLISIITDTTVNTMVRTQCEQHGIPFVYAHIPEHEHFLGGGGHLMAAGHMTLGTAIHEALRILPVRSGIRTNP